MKNRFQDIHPTPREAVDAAFNDPEEMAKNRSDWEAYDFFLKHGYNKNVNYELYQRAWSLLDRFLDQFNSIGDLIKSTPFQKHLWYNLNLRHTQTGCLNDENLTQMIEYMENHV